MWNASLKHCFEHPEVPRTESVHDRAVLALHNLFKPEKCDKAIEDVQALHKALAASWNCTCASPHEGNLRMNWHVKRAFPSARFEMALSREEITGGIPSVAWKTMEMTVITTTDQNISKSQQNLSPEKVQKPSKSAKPGIKVRFKELNLFRTSKAPNHSTRQGPGEWQVPYLCKYDFSL